MSQREKGQSQTAWLPKIRMYPMELGYVQKCAKDAGLSLSEYVRSQLATPHTVDLPDRVAIVPSSPLHSNPIVTTQQDSPLSPQTLSSQNVIPSTPKALHGSAFINDTIARKVGHESGCTCTFCARMRTVLSTSKQDKPKAVRKR